MDRFTRIESLVVPLNRANIDTDAILPKQFMKSISRTGFGPNLFDELRYLDQHQPGLDNQERRLNPDFPLNQSRYLGSQILLTRENFGCGSSREHAPWALRDFGIRSILAPSFADIFSGNCLKNGLLPIVLDTFEINTLFSEVDISPGYWLTIDLISQTILKPDGTALKFDIGSVVKNKLLAGLDDIDITLEQSEAIAAYEACRREIEPWVF
ncbi:3-isopropylmalate dehydratase small subunit [Candidatus Thalassolituus haligoni]|uniref:3-isopropylmalate dehydratase small subunit n=1 Tax=Candidatus Thalassolituus haligoni TaxID=3100113 RepID=UPI0035120FEB|tara:strand:+ start:8908 stop:9543 length:636 start_codon:yes stop_codon:yes gene_type:complete